MCVIRDNRFTPVSCCQWPKLNIMGRHLVCVFRDNRFTPVSCCQWPKLNTMGRHLVCVFRDSRFAEQDSQPFFPSMAKVKHHGKTAGVCIQGQQIRRTGFTQVPAISGQLNTMGMQKSHTSQEKLKSHKNNINDNSYL